jgi:hypothetical protein
MRLGLFFVDGLFTSLPTFRHEVIPLGLGANSSSRSQTLPLLQDSLSRWERDNLSFLKNVFNERDE